MAKVTSKMRKPNMERASNFFDGSSLIKELRNSPTAMEKAYMAMVIIRES